MAGSQVRFGFLFILLLVLLRVSIGWHFFKEGAKKIHSEDFTAKYFLQQAKGPLATFFYAQIPDYRGEQRLDRNAIVKRWKDYNAEIVSRLQFNEDQQKRAAAVLQKHQNALNNYFARWGGDISTYLAEWDRLDEARRAPTSGLDYEADRINAKQAELWSTPTKWYADLRALDKAFQADVLALASGDENGNRVKPLRDLSASWIDPFMTYMIFSVGVLLILGLFTRLASLVGAGFLASVLATQPFWVKGSELSYSYYQFVELMALLLLAAAAAGRFAGLDYFVHAMRMRCCPPKQEMGDELNT